MNFFGSLLCECLKSSRVLNSNIVSPTITGIVNTDPIEIDPRCPELTLTMVSIEKPQYKEDSESILALHLQPPVSKHYFNETVDDNKVQIKSVSLLSEEDQTDLECPSKVIRLG